jgi:hypothetical protein
MSTMHMGRMLAAGILMQAAPGCSTGTALNGEASRKLDDVASTPSVPEGSQPVAFVEIPGARMQLSAHNEPARLVIRDAAAWEAYWGKTVANVSPAPPAPSVDFARQMVLATAMGQRPSGGYSIVIDSVYSSGGTLYAVVRSVSPGPNCIVPAVMSAPVVAVRVDRAAGPVRFVERAETQDCG